MNYCFKPFDLCRIKEDFNISDDALLVSGFSVKDLEEIYKDYIGRYPQLEEVKRRFLSEYVISAKDVHFHSYSGRVKEPDHLLEKLIRKKRTNNKYTKMISDDYYKYITDIVGCRILLVYKEDWCAIHDYFTKEFPNKAVWYIDEKDYVGSYDHPHAKRYIAEQPCVYVRAGDDLSIYRNINGIKIDEKGYYRSVHYVFRFDDYYLELQVRSLFDEAWGEVDHDVLYPYYKGNSKLVSFSRLLNRTAGLGNEMSAYFKRYAFEGTFEKDTSLLDIPIEKINDNALGIRELSSLTVSVSNSLEERQSSVKDILDKTIKEV